jgi:sulfur transfer protein SufE
VQDNIDKVEVCFQNIFLLRQMRNAIDFFCILSDDIISDLVKLLLVEISDDMVETLLSYVVPEFFEGAATELPW